MRNVEVKTWDVGVIIGRFQVDDLHLGHRELFDEVIARHSKVIVVVGRAPIPCSYSNPLDVQARTQMIYSAYPDVLVAHVSDQRSDEAWSQSLDRVVSELLGPNQTAVFYGSRDSFTSSYSGRFDALVLEPSHGTSGTARRTELARVAKGSADFRAGAIWASQQRYNNPIPAVDIAIFKPDFSAILLGRKPAEDGWRLPGGMVDMTDKNLKAAAIREAFEETSCKISSVAYVDSFQQDDWRYRGEPNGIMTNLFVATTADEPVAADDLAEVMWKSIETTFPFESTHPVIREHTHLVESAVRYINRQAKEASND